MLYLLLPFVYKPEHSVTVIIQAKKEPNKSLIPLAHSAIKHKPL